MCPRLPPTLPHQGRAGHGALIKGAVWGVQAVVPEAFSLPTVALHRMRYHSIGRPDSGRGC